MTLNDSTALYYPMWFFSGRLCRSE